MKYELTDEELITTLKEAIAERDEIIKQQKTVIEKMRAFIETLCAFGVYEEYDLINSSQYGLEHFGDKLDECFYGGIEREEARIALKARQTLKEVGDEIFSN